MTNTKNETIQTPLVSIILLVYNQSEFLKQAIEGLLMQHTSFHFEIIIHDDASTDNSDKIIEEYVLEFPHLIKAIYQHENKYSLYGINYLFQFVVSKANGKYIAMCAGDDFWIDPLKLQKQVIFLESNPEYALVHTKAAVYIEEESNFEGTRGYEVDSFETLLNENTIAAVTVCIRKGLLNKYFKQVRPQEHLKWPAEDFPTWLWLIQNSKFKFLKDYTAVYRSRMGSLSHIEDDRKRLYFGEGLYDVIEYYLSNNENIVDANKIRARYYSNMVSMYFLTRNYVGIRQSIKVFYNAKDWFNLIWIMITLPFFCSSFMIKASYKFRYYLFKLLNIYPVKS